MDTYTKVTTKGYSSRIGNSIKGVFIGLLMFIASFFILWTNEGSVDLSKIAKTSIEVNPTDINTTNNDMLISISGNIESSESIGDTEYLKQGEYIAISRKVEMFSWEETSTTETEKNLGGSETTTTKYKYNKIWTEFPANSNNFEIQAGHINPQKKLDSSTNTVDSSNIGKYNIATKSITLNTPSKVKLTEDNIIVSENNGTVLTNSYLFDGEGKINSPQVGDIRISYTSLNKGSSVTIMGKQDGNKIVSYSDGRGNTLFRIFNGTRDEAIGELKTEYLIMLWVLRALGFFLMFIGLTMLLGPISVFLDFVPVAGGISRFIIGILAFVISIVLSIATIVISIIFHNIFALIAVIAIIGFFVYNKARKNKKLKGSNNETNQTSNKDKENSNIKEISKENKNNNSMVDFDTE